jgi:hypothetical protein
MTTIGGIKIDEQGYWNCPTCDHREYVGSNILKASNAAAHIATHLPRG